MNCFQFEELNRKVLRFHGHGHDLIGEEFIKIFSTIQCMNVFIAQTSHNNSVIEFIRKKMNIKTSNHKEVLSESGPTIEFKIASKIKILENDQCVDVFGKYTNKKFKALDVAALVFINGIRYDTINSTTKHSDAGIQADSNRYGIIQHFIIFEDKLYVIAKYVHKLYCPFYYTLEPNLKSKMFIAYMADDFFVSDVRNIKKVAMMKLELPLGVVQMVNL
jgi:hypothetical protein